MVDMGKLIDAGGSGKRLSGECRDLEAAGFPVSQLMALVPGETAASPAALAPSIATRCLKSWIHGLDVPAYELEPRDEAFRRLHARRLHLQQELTQVLASMEVGAD